MSSSYGRLKHGSNPEQDKFDGYVKWVIQQLKKLPNNRSVRKKYFEALTKKRTDKDAVEQAVKARWS